MSKYTVRTFFNSAGKKPAGKKKGNIGDLIGTMVCLLFIIMIMFSMISFMKIVGVKRELNTINKAALLSLESDGELNSTYINNLYDNLHTTYEDVTVYVNGATVPYGSGSTKAYNGETVSVEIVINATVRELGLTSIWGAFTDDYEIRSKLYSLSKTQRKEG